MIEHLGPVLKSNFERQQQKRQRRFERRLARLPLKQQFRLAALRLFVPLGIIGGGLIIFAIFGN
jgi:hypothetical protein